MFHASASKFAALCSGDGKSISEWLQTQLSALHTRTDDTGDNDDIATQAKHSETWRSSLLSLQEQYVSYMTVIVGYQDAVGADVYEFAASYPYVCLANSLAPESSSSSDENSTLAMDINTVRTKYAKEISDKMTEEMRTSCFPYWKRLENLKQQLQERFTTTPSQTNDGLKAAFASLQPGVHLEVDMAACGQLLGDEMHHPKLLIALNDHLQRLRNEKRLMQQLSPAARARCAFTTRSATTDRFTNEALNDEDQPSGLTKWLLVKLHQLKEDLQIHERPKVEQLLLTPPAARVSPSAAAQRAKRTTRSTEESSVDAQTLLQTIPTFRCLLQTFAVSYEKPRRDSTENQALVALDELWDRFQLPAWDSLLGDEGPLSSGRSTAPVVGGMNLHMKKRLLGNADGAASPSSELSSPNDPSFALCSLHMSSATALVQFCNTGVLVLPPPSIIEDQLSYLEISVELTWVNADMKELEEQYKKLMLHRKTHREHQRLSSATPRKPPKYPQAVPGPTCSTAASSLLALSKYFHEEGVPDDKAQQSESSSSGNGGPPERKPKKREPAPVFVVPASEMAQFLHDITSKCVEHSQQLLDLQNTAMQQLRDQSQAVVIECQKIEKQWAKAKAEERIRREAFAVDHAFHLYFEVEALRKQLGVVEARRELEQQILRCDLNAEYDEKLRVMHAELLNKQQKFAEYRTTM
ncbi:hypothetical protein PR001_g27789, partial [Phytophthora rubi]